MPNQSSTKPSNERDNMNAQTNNLNVENAANAPGGLNTLKCNDSNMNSDTS